MSEYFKNKEGTCASGPCTFTELQTMEDIFVTSQTIKSIYDRISCPEIDCWWFQDWMETGLLETVFPEETWYNGDKYTQREKYYLLGYNKLVGGFRVTQSRVDPNVGSCYATDRFQVRTRIGILQPTLRSVLRSFLISVASIPLAVCIRRSIPLAGRHSPKTRRARGHLDLVTTQRSAL